MPWEANCVHGYRTVVRVLCRTIRLQKRVYAYHASVYIGTASGNQIAIMSATVNSFQAMKHKL